MFSKGIAVIALTKKGVETATKISAALERQEIKNNVFSPEQCVPSGTMPLDMRLGEFIKEIFGKVDAIISVMATGIVVRTIAPCLRSKLSDPAVVCVDVSGRFAISLLSGHHGGANELTRIIAREIGAIPVITTASEVMGKMSIDEVARLLHCKIQNPSSLVAVNSALVNEKHVGLFLVGGVRIPVNMIFGYDVKHANTVKEAVDALKNFDAGAIITEKPASTKLLRTIAILVPKKVIVGIGARKNSSASEIVAAVNSALARVDLPLERIDRLATVDIKKASQSVLSAAEKLGLPIDFVNVEALRSVEHGGLSPDSRLVEEKIGVGGVCERAALIIAGRNAVLMLKKMKQNGVTVAVAEGE
ncbi:MAG: cobalt-precorrin 5A hydrolase [Candidatus Bathyarchaeota archaeon]|nr:cobalt-precorrin 5A hydrolase [Candidatus Bathyarchaeota archaeon]